MSSVLEPREIKSSVSAGSIEVLLDIGSIPTDNHLSSPAKVGVSKWRKPSGINDAVGVLPNWAAQVIVSDQSQAERSFETDSSRAERNGECGDSNESKTCENLQISDDLLPYDATQSSIKQHHSYESESSTEMSHHTKPVAHHHVGEESEEGDRRVHVKPIPGKHVTDVSDPLSFGSVGSQTASSLREDNCRTDGVIATSEHSNKTNKQLGELSEETSEQVAAEQSTVLLNSQAEISDNAATMFLSTSLKPVLLDTATAPTAPRVGDESKSADSRSSVKMVGDIRISDESTAELHLTRVRFNSNFNSTVESTQMAAKVSVKPVEGVHVTQESNPSDAPNKSCVKFNVDRNSTTESDSTQRSMQVTCFYNCCSSVCLILI